MHHGMAWELYQEESKGHREGAGELYGGNAGKKKSIYCVVKREQLHDCICINGQFPNVLQISCLLLEHVGHGKLSVFFFFFFTIVHGR